MPEGHTLFRLARDQTHWLAGKTIRAWSPQGRFDEGAALLDGASFRRAESRGKHLVWRFSGLAKPRVVHIHLGLAGRFRRFVRKVPEPRDSVRIRIESTGCTLDLSGPAICELLTYPKLRKLYARIGEDPLQPEADPDRVFELLARTRRPLGAVLLDQSVISGIGNVYRAELLFLHRLAPQLPARELGRERFDALWADSARLLGVGVELGRIVTRGDTLADMRRRRRGERLWVYKRRSCLACGAGIESMRSAGRTLYFCPECQR